MNAANSRVEQVADRLRSLIHAHYFSDGRLPSEPELARNMGASRATIRQALERLARAGLIVRRHGVGTFVNHQVLNIRTRLEEVWDFDEMIRAAGYQPGVRHLELDLAGASVYVAEQPALPAGAEVIVTATGVSNGDLLRGVRFLADSARTHSLVMCTRCNWVRFVDGVHFFAQPGKIRR